MIKTFTSNNWSNVHSILDNFLSFHFSFQRSILEMQKYIKFEISPNLDRFWKIIGFSDKEREIEKNRLSDILTNSYEKFVKDVSVDVQHLFDEVVEIQNEFRRLVHKYGDTKENLPITNDLPLLKQLEINKNALDNLKSKYEKREEEFEESHSQIIHFFNILGIPEEGRGDYNEIGDSDLTKERLQMFQQRLSSLKNEAEKRTILLNNLNDSLQSLSDELFEELPAEISQIFENEKYDNESLSILDEYHDYLINLKIERTEKINKLNKRITYLYNILAIDPLDQINVPTALSADTIDELQSEVDFLESNMKSRLPSVVKKLNEAISKLCDVLEIPMKKRPIYKYEKDEDLETSVVYLKGEFEKLTQRHNKMKPIIDLIYERDALYDIINMPAMVASKNSAPTKTTPTKAAPSKTSPTKNTSSKNSSMNSTQNISGQFKEKKMARIELAKLEVNLYKLLMEYRNENGHDFEYGGVIVINTIDTKKYPNEIVDGKNLLKKKIESASATMNQIAGKQKAQTPTKPKAARSMLYRTPQRK
ncbi:hypothetical protein TRFO_24834 [Tritrichomonas foetus]|uniref:Uncharacterized protein n=1 Tax=Tritrichomonas foetus TaxID=1144522 RepID=A0A1J4K6Z7_9EUKA|nr:hypothetical protein TRFO_24834 [Tritrichomonas foetus]|eukprot:OHT06963.1 hypothetical protein TRFO_24834 [Tritrichomonas foetus]